MMKNHYQHTRFHSGTPNPEKATPDVGMEVAFAGRSNAGKSSALNAITDQRALARTGKTPGRTQQINFFTVDDQRRLVDLPGYGYAKVSRAIKARWQRAIAEYLETRRSLRGVILLMDIRHPLKEVDRQLLDWCHAAGLSTHVLLTKADKLKHGPANAALLEARRMIRDLHPAATVQLFSALTRAGADDARTILDDWLEFPADGAPGDSHDTPLPPTPEKKNPGKGEKPGCQ
jgi:GTP-binding protein